MDPIYKPLLERLAAGFAGLPDKPEETPESTLRALWHAATGNPLSAELAVQQALPAMDVAATARLDALIVKRLDGIPLAHLTERQRFVGMEMLAGPGALIPRKETELLAKAAIDLARELVVGNPTIKAVDVCTGSGNVALAIARHVPEASVFAADLSEDAVGLARKNAEHLRLTARAQFLAGDLLKPFENDAFLGKVDLLTCNPPYISSAKVVQMAGEIAEHEPRLAFDGGPFGVAILMRLLDEAPRYVRSGGWLAFEVGLGQGQSLAKKLERGGQYRVVRPLKDERGDIRALVAQR